MEKKKKIFGIIIGIIIIATIYFSGILKPNNPSATESEAKCLGEKSTFYYLTGCTFCKKQEAMFGENLKYLNMVECSEQPEKCVLLTGVPAWNINGKFYEGVQPISKLKELTGC